MGFGEGPAEAGIEFVIDGGGSPIEVGIAGDLEVPFNCEIEAATLLAAPSGSIKIDIWKDTYANFPPDNADSICGGNEPEIVAGVKDQDTTLTGWTKTLKKGDILRFNVDSCTDVTRITVSLKARQN